MPPEKDEDPEMKIRRDYSEKSQNKEQARERKREDRSGNVSNDRDDKQRKKGDD